MLDALGGVVRLQGDVSKSLANELFAGALPKELGTC